MSGHPINPLSDQFHKATAPTPGFRGATTSPSASELTHHDHHPVHQDSLSTNLGRGGGHSGTQGCSHRMAHNPDKVSARQRLNRHIAPNGGAAQLSESLSSQPPQPARLRVYSQYGPTRTTAQAVDRSQCGARSNAAGTPQHGTASAYQNFYCRCPDARELYRLHLKRRREGRLAPLMLDSLGTARRLRALAYLGWTTEALAKWFAEHPELLKGRTVRGGMSASRLNGLRNPTYKRIWAPQAELIGISYTALSATPAPNTTEAQRLRKYAKRAGWAPPLAWDDNIDDAHAQPQHLLENHNDEGDDGDMHVLLAGHVKHPTSFETPADHWRWRNLLVRAIHVLAERGFSLDEISVRLNISERQVVRLKKIDDGQLCRASRFNKKAPPAGTTPSTGTPREAHVA